MPAAATCTNEVSIDGSYAYEFTYYFKLNDLGKQLRSISA